MRCVSFLFLGSMGLVACGIEPEPRAPSALDVGPAPGALEYRVHGPDGDSVREVTPSSPEAEWVELAFTPDRSAIASATCTRIVDRVGEETVTWTLVGRGS